MEVICVTGVPGTGKTTLSKKIAKKLNYYYIDVNKLISKYKLSENYDKKRRTKIVDVNKLNYFLISEINSIKNKSSNQKSNNDIQLKNKIKKYNGIIIDSHLSHYLPKKYVDFCIVTKCDVKKLNRRLKNKKFHKEKIKENLEAEIFDICYNEAIEGKHKVITVDTTKGFNINAIASYMMFRC